MASAPFLVKIKEDFLSCAICSEEFKRPKALKCQHTFCEKCLTDYIIKTAYDHNEKREFLCPICREIIDAPDQTSPPSEWASKIKNNFVLNGIHDFLNSTKHFQSSKFETYIPQDYNTLSLADNFHICKNIPSH